ncbi:ABC transporter substrate-binding protein [Neobacillus niacini]|uniref:ABC transporter substrate-binding protein n=1 Tax=Neobacillus niacini TaxID=86668 RepID=UPI0021CB5086|nr:ABC transporter substrate-binding protein [Neobacillus niacini]MCM3768591.1 ABC transporter substrate-binding protein [Neobacillus niacini]
MNRLIEDYKAIRDFYQHHPVQAPITTTMEELAELWFCTQRNAKLILTKLTESGLVSFSPGRGRGNKSHLTFLKSVDEATFVEAISLFKAGRITEGFELAAAYGTPALKNRLLQWLTPFFGYEKQEVKDIIRLPMFRTFNSMVPSQAFFDFDVHLIRQVYDTIVAYDYSSETAAGKLAHHWECNEDQTEWTFFLKKGVLFHNGKELTSEDIHYTFSLLLQPDFKQFWLVENIRFIECLDPYTVQFIMHKPNALFLAFLSFPVLSIIPSGSAGYIGTGPFMVHTYDKNYCVLEANPHYFEGRPFVDRFEILNVPKEYEKELLEDKSSIFVNTGEGNYFDSPLKKHIEGIYEGSTLFTFNLRKKWGPHQSIHFRQAVNKLIDRNKLIGDLGPPRMTPSYSFEMRQSLLATPINLEDGEIKTLLQVSGYLGETLHLFTYDRHQTDAEWIKREAARYGIQIEVTILGWSEILNQENIDQADCILFEAVWGEQELSKLELYQSGFSFLRQHLEQDTAEFIDRKIVVLLSTSNAKERSQLFAEIEDRLIAETAAVFLVHKNLASSFDPSIKGVQLNAHGQVDFKNIWIKPELTKRSG